LSVREDEASYRIARANYTLRLPGALIQYILQNLSLAGSFSILG
jgi:hypothetical protein